MTQRNYATCPHQTYSDNHCAEMVCWNYVNKCPKHAPSGRDYYVCSRSNREAADARPLP